MKNWSSACLPLVFCRCQQVRHHSGQLGILSFLECQQCVICMVMLCVCLYMNNACALCIYLGVLSYESTCMCGDIYTYIKCLHVWVCVLSVCMFLCVYSYVGVHVWMHAHVAYTCNVHVSVCYVWVLILLPLCVWLRVAAVSDSFARSELVNRRFGFCSLWTRFTRRFEDWLSRWSGDPYLFVQRRPDGDSDPKLRHFMQV